MGRKWHQWENRKENPPLVIKQDSTSCLTFAIKHPDDSQDHQGVLQQEHNLELFELKLSTQAGKNQNMQISVHKKVWVFNRMHITL